MVINTPMGIGPHLDSFSIRRSGARVPRAVLHHGCRRRGRRRGRSCASRRASIAVAGVSTAGASPRFCASRHGSRCLAELSAAPLTAFLEAAAARWILCGGVRRPPTGELLAGASAERRRARRLMPAALAEPCAARSIVSALRSKRSRPIRHRTASPGRGSCAACSRARATGGAASPATRRPPPTVGRAASPRPGRAWSPRTLTYDARRETWPPTSKRLSQPVQFVRGVGPQPRGAVSQARHAHGRGPALPPAVPLRGPAPRSSRCAIAARRRGRERDRRDHPPRRTLRRPRSQRRILEGALRDETGLLALTWYHQIAYFRSRYQVGAVPVRARQGGGGPMGAKRMVHPEIDAVARRDGRRGSCPSTTSRRR